MRTRILRWPLLAAVWLALVVAVPADAATLIGLTPDSRLIQFDSAAPEAANPPTPVSGLQMGESLLGIDFRPSTGQLYGLGSTFRLYTINPATGEAAAVAPPTTTIPGNSFGFDFNPVTDRIRVVSDQDANVSIDPTTGLVTPGNNLTYGGMSNPNVVAAGFSNNVAGATSTILHGIDSNLNVLVNLNESTGEGSSVGPLNVDPGDLIGFDIAQDGMAYFVAGSFFHPLNLQTGAAGTGGTVPAFLNGLTVVPPPGTPGGGTPGGGQPGTGLPGDFDLNGSVDAADYVLWRKGVLSEDGLTVRVQTPNGVLDGDTSELYNVWRSNFGRSLGSERASAAQRRRRKAIVFARNTSVLRGEESKRVRIRLTKAGRRLVRGYKRKRLSGTLTLTVTYRPASGAAAQKRTFKQKVTLRVKRKRR